MNESARDVLIGVLRARVGSLMGPPPPKPKHGPFCDPGCGGCRRIHEWRLVHQKPRQVVQCLNLEHVRNLQTLRSIQWARTKDRKWGEAEQVGKRNRGVGRARVRSGSKLPRGAR